MTTFKFVGTAMILCFLPFCVHSQGKFIQKFQYLAQTQTVDVKVPFTFYYIVDSSISFKHKGITFYQFTFSEDSTDKNGFIGYDMKSGDLNFAADSSKREKENTGKLFRLKTSGSITNNHVLALSNTLIKTTDRNTLRFTVRLSGPIQHHDSHTVYLDRIEFEKGILYPRSMTFFFPFDGGYITLFPK
jgi:hypothetical protein